MRTIPAERYTDPRTGTTLVAVQRFNDAINRHDVDAVMAQAATAGARIVKPAHDTFWGGYAGYFLDPDQHLWEVAWNPQWVLDA